MNIDDQLSRMGVRSSDAHRATLRARLLSHRKEMKMKPRRWSLLVLWIAVPVCAMMLIAAVNFLPSLGSGGQTAIKKIVEPLTAKEVLAIAHEQAALGRLADGEYYFAKIKIVRGVSDDCGLYTEYHERYTDEAGDLVRMVDRDANGELISIWSPTPDGEHYHNPNHIPGSTASVGCSYPSIDDEKWQLYNEHLALIGRAWGFGGNDQKGPEAGAGLMYQDLNSGNPVKQRAAFEKMQTLDEWSVRRDVRIDEYDRPLISLHYEVSGFIYEDIYFDQATKKYVGTEQSGWQGLDQWILVSQDIKPIEPIAY